MGELTRSMGELQAWLQASPPGTLVDARALAQALAASVPDVSRTIPTSLPTSWRERLWLAPLDTRIGVPELLEAIGRTRSWLYRHTGPSSAGARIPHRKLDGELVFLVGEVRQWLLENEIMVVPGRTASLVIARGRKIHGLSAP